MYTLAPHIKDNIDPIADEALARFVVASHQRSTKQAKDVRLKATERELDETREALVVTMRRSPLARALSFLVPR